MSTWLVAARQVECRRRCVKGSREGCTGCGGRGDELGSGGVDEGAELVGLDVVHRLARGDLGQPLAGAPQLPRDLARTHLRRVEQEGTREGKKEGRWKEWWRNGGKKSTKSKEIKEEEKEVEEEGSRRDNDS